MKTNGSNTKSGTGRRHIEYRGDWSRRADKYETTKLSRQLALKHIMPPLKKHPFSEIK